MVVMVDEVRGWPHAQAPFKRGSCHLTATSVAELHRFALRLGLKRAWFQDHPIAPHYDLTPRARLRAVQLGAVELSAREQARARRDQLPG